MKEELREEAIRLRKEERLSYSEIKEKFDVAKGTLSYWLRDYPLTDEEIKRRQKEGWKKAQASREKHSNTMRRKKEKKKQQIYETKKEEIKDLSSDAFHIAGLMLYYAEGSKTRSRRIKLANTDHRVLSFFICWLDKFLEVSKENIKAELHLYEDMDIEGEVNYWQEKLGLEKDQFYKPQVREVKENSFTYSESHRHGTCGKYYGSVEKKRELMQGINAFLDIADNEM